MLNPNLFSNSDVNAIAEAPARQSNSLQSSLNTAIFESPKKSIRLSQNAAKAKSPGLNSRFSASSAETNGPRCPICLDTLDEVLFLMISI